MKRSYFCPEDFTLTDDLLAWATNEFNISEKEAQRQLTLMLDHEFRRPYSSWTRVYRNWIRKAEEIGQLRRERKPRLVEEISDEQRQRDILAFHEDMKRFKVI